MNEMKRIIIMDCDTYVKSGLTNYFTSKKNSVMVTSSLGDLLINLHDHDFDILITELFSREDNILDVINFIRNFNIRLPNKRLIIYTSITSEFAIRLIYCSTQHTEIIFKKDNDIHLVCSGLNLAGNETDCISSTVRQWLSTVPEECILTTKEWQLLYRLVHDKDASLIAGDLNINKKTVSNNIVNIAKKLNCQNRIDLWINLSELIYKECSRAQ
jgi:DNA-binding NarL/FixJ family response regulator